MIHNLFVKRWTMEESLSFQFINDNFFFHTTKYK